MRDVRLRLDVRAAVFSARPHRPALSAQAARRILSRPPAGEGAECPARNLETAAQLSGLNAASHAIRRGSQLKDEWPSSSGEKTPSLPEPCRSGKRRNAPPFAT